MNIWNVLWWNVLHQACMHPCKHVIWKFLVKALQRLPDNFVKFWNYMQLYKVWNKGLVLLSVSPSWEYVYYILSLSYGWNETVMFQWKVNLDDVILVFLFLTLGISTVAVLANQLEPEKYEYWFKTFVLDYFLVICIWPRLEPHFALFEKFKRLRFTSEWYRNLPCVNWYWFLLKHFLIT